MKVLKNFSKQRIKLSSIALFLSVTTVFSQNSIVGKIFDGSNDLELGYVTVSLKGKSTNFIGGGISDAKGEFVVENIPTGSFEISVKYLGYEDFLDEIAFDTEAQQLQYDIILIKKREILKGTEVTGMRTQMKFELDRKVFDVSASSIAEGASASDILTDIPSIEISTDGSISLRGSASVVIWINGKESGLNADNQAQILEQLPANTIEKVEIITNPSSKFSSEGTAGIINIVLKKDRQAGYYGSVQAGINSQLGYNAGVNINYSGAKFETFASVGYRNRQTNRGGYSNRLFFDKNNPSDTLGYLNQTTGNVGKGHSIFARMGVTYHITPKNHISLSGFGMFGNNNNTTVVDYSSNLNNYPYLNKRISTGNNNMNGGNIVLGYKYDISKSSNIDMSVGYNIWNRGGKNDFDQISYFNANNVLDTTLAFQQQISDMNNNSIEAKVDYTTTIDQRHKIEAGFQGNYSISYSPIHTYSGTDKNNLSITPSLYNNYSYNQNISALYATYSSKFGKFNFQTGLRGELSNMIMRSANYGENIDEVTPFKTTYFNLFPSAFLNYELPKDNQIQLNYTRRITRPWGRLLNPFRNITDSTNISYGNPYLTPEFSNSLELNYIKTWDNHILSLSSYFRNTNDVIQIISYLENRLMYSTQVNIAQTMSSGVELVLKNRLTKFLDFTSTVNLFYQHLKAWEYDPDGDNNPIDKIYGKGQDNFSWNIRMTAQVVLPLGITAQITGGYVAPRAIAQGSTQGNYFLDFGLRKSFGNFSLNLNGRDLLNSKSNKTYKYGSGFEQEANSWRQGRIMALTVTYSFGNMKPNYKKNRDQNRQNSEEPTNGDGDDDF